MTRVNDIPELRFKGFSGTWEESSLDIIAEILDGDRGHNYPNGNDLQATGHTLFLSASNVTANGFKLGTTQYINEEKSNYMGNGKLILDDIILTSRGSVGHIAWYNEYIKQKVPFARINSGMLILRSKSHIAPSIVAQILKSPAGKKKIDLISSGSAQPQLTKMSVSAYTVTIPSDKTEQVKIGYFFKNIDNQINLKQIKLDKLIILKKAMLEKMFPKEGEARPEIRFKGFSGTWKRKTLGVDVANIVGGGTPSTSDTSYWNGDINWYSPTEIGEEVFADGSEKRITKLGLEKSSACLLPANKTVLFTSRAGIGYMAILKRDGATNQGFQSLVVKEGFDVYFVYSIGYLIKRYAFKFASGSTFLEISGKTLGKMEVLTPTLEEQTKIGSYFKKLDNLISLQKTELTKLKQIKVSCLEKMFV